MRSLSSYRFNIDFLGVAKWAILFSTILIVASLMTWFKQGEDKYGVDYRGGTEFVVRFDSSITVDQIRSQLEVNKFDAVVQSFQDANNEYSIRISDSGDVSAIRKSFDAALNASFGGGSDGSKFSVLQTNYVGPTIGNELRQKALWAVLFSLITMLIYIAWRFEFAFALGAVIALFHDVIIATGVYLISGRTIGISTLAAALTIVGYSVNDTIVIFDRVREEITKDRDFDLKKVLNSAVNQMLSRTIITSLLTLFSASMLYIYGGGAISDFSFYLVIGLIAGSYSTIFIASPVVLYWEQFAAKRDARKAAAAKAA